LLLKLRLLTSEAATKFDCVLRGYIEMKGAANYPSSCPNTGKRFDIKDAISSGNRSNELHARTNPV